LNYCWTWTEFQKLQIGSGSQNMTIRSSLMHSKSATHRSKVSLHSAAAEVRDKDERTVKVFNPSPILFWKNWFWSA